ncbi:hypothetical protein QQ045_030958 [Rhodiola kirilowii]
MTGKQISRQQKSEPVYKAVYLVYRFGAELVDHCIPESISQQNQSVDMRLGYPRCAPYNVIHVGATGPQIPQQLLDQLKPGGRLVIPVENIAQDLKAVDKG